MVNRFEYRRCAEDCLLQAEQTGSPDAKSALMMMAGAWHPRRLGTSLARRHFRRPRRFFMITHVGSERASLIAYLLSKTTAAQ